MFHKRKKHPFLGREFVWLWAALAFQAGFANAGGFLVTTRFVSHMTGFGTQVGLSFANLNFGLAMEMLGAPISFLLGVLVSGALVDRRLLTDKQPLVLPVMALIVSVYAIVALGGVGDLLVDHDVLLMALLCFACGMQNACFSSLTLGAIRTTHLTGGLTDIGTTFMKLRHMSASDRRAKVMKRTNLIRILIFVCFSLGSAASALMFSSVGYLGFAFLTAFAAMLLIAVAVYETAPSRSRRRTFGASPGRPAVVK